MHVRHVLENEKYENFYSSNFIIDEYYNNATWHNDLSLFGRITIYIVTILMNKYAVYFYFYL